MSKFRFTVEFEIDSRWISDGYFLTAERALNMLGQELDFADVNTEINARLVKIPKLEHVARAQGYSSSAAMQRDNPLIDYTVGVWINS
jgi:hypothetical protein